jgi:NADP-dependent 3-hydroxy acid dehydrogenase YdfG
MSTREYAVITGASSGIGAATARLLADNGYHVIAAARRFDRLNELTKSNSQTKQVSMLSRNIYQVSQLQL